MWAPAETLRPVAGMLNPKQNLPLRQNGQKYNENNGAKVFLLHQ